MKRNAVERIAALEARVAGLEAAIAPPTFAGASPLAHIISPARGVYDASRGAKNITSLCGATIAGDSPEDAPVCRTCWNLNIPRQQEEARGWMTTERNTGVASGRADSMREIREAAEKRAGELAAAS